ncbi:MAG TPA: hypothetical protein VK590_04970, partial [Saprospiraceae bacterium]|nr:hypothetical protein [Saprospiraceae bacterium]
MKNLQKVKCLVLFMILSSLGLYSQDTGMQYFRSWDKNGINVFEPSKSDDQPEFKGLHLKIGASFTQNYQSLKHSNTPIYHPESPTNPVNQNLLYGTTRNDSTSATLTGFNTAMANLNLDVQLGDGIRMCVESYMSTRHHNEFWVKGGYIQIDRLPMLGNPDWFKKHVRLKVGHFQPNFGDMQFRRSDGGNGMYNPFVENYILESFTTEIGGELYIYPFKGLMLMGGMSGGTLEGNIDNADAKPAPFTFDPTPRNAAIHAKIAYENKINKLRFRVSASIYNNDGSPNQTLYYGDRAGSQYSMVMEQNRSLLVIEGIPSGIGQSTYVNNKDSGRFNPLFLSKVSSFMANLFLKYDGLEFFGTYENAEGKAWYEPQADDRKASQVAGELIFRFGKDEQVYLGARYNELTARPQFATADATITRLTAVAGWRPLDYLNIKLEYVTQEYKDFSGFGFDYRYNGKFSGIVLSGTVGF